MARKRTKTSKNAEYVHGIHDLVGIIVSVVALLFLVALFTHDPRDLAANTTVPNESPTNWLGGFGARAAHGLFFVFGGGAFLLPVAGLAFGLRRLFEIFDYLKRCWIAGIVWLVATTGFLELFNDTFSGFQRHLNIGSAGGLIGQKVNGVLGFFGAFGASGIYLMMYLYAVAALTDHQLFPLLRMWFDRWKDWRAANAFEEKQIKDTTVKEKPSRLKRTVEPRTDSGEAEEEETEASEPDPEPVIRDMSFSTARPQNEVEAVGAAAEEDNPGAVDEGGSKSNEDEDKSEADEEEDDGEPKPATVDEILGKTGSGRPARRLPRMKPPAPTGKPIRVADAPIIGDYKLPNLGQLDHGDPTARPTDSREELMSNAKLMQTTLAQFGIEVGLGDITKGPTITRYELNPAPGIKLEKIANLSNNMAAALRAERINILAPIPGKSSVGIEVPNRVKTAVIMRDLLESPEWIKAKGKIPVALGKDVYGHPIIADLSDMPHLLIAGATGAGKSVCINAVIASLLYRFAPDELRFVMIDPKVVELQQYNALPHLVVPVVTDPKKVVVALRWVVNEMEKRYQIFAKVGVRNIHSFNKRKRDEAPKPSAEPELPLTATKENVEAGADGFAVQLDEEIVVPRDDDIVVPDKLSFIVVVIDELADLMLVAPADVELAIARITQMARAAGIHCIVATQRPSVDVITGVIKANIPARIAFQVASKVDSRTILDAMGADKLLGKGDMLYLPPGSARPVRIQGVLITDEEIQTVVDSIAAQGQPSYEAEIHKELQKPAASGEKGSNCDEDEELIQRCIEVIRVEEKASVSLLQRKLRLGYTRAARIMDELEDRGVVGPSRGAEPREILIDLDAV
jgi:S-DNA-T family DNA segregation ATPase FtsK/SpoIIIE